MGIYGCTLVLLYMFNYYCFFHQELECYQEGLSCRPAVLVVNKMDIQSAEQELPSLLKVTESMNKFCSVVPTSAQLSVGVEAVIEAIVNALHVNSINISHDHTM